MSKDAKNVNGNDRHCIWEVQTKIFLGRKLDKQELDILVEERRNNISSLEIEDFLLSEQNVEDLTDEEYLDFIEDNFFENNIITYNYKDIKHKKYQDVYIKERLKSRTRNL
uniref:Uncharacterized protein n=1 Tax=Pithovirus LCDPAC02 TaxID=2506601 RepID=A0A481YPU3_9VIRU|nr:MAG: hypothetical protein LCDPAC02_02980 [Pithovirus LCDPAC02]